MDLQCILSIAIRYFPVAVLSLLLMFLLLFAVVLFGPRTETIPRSQPAAVVNGVIGQIIKIPDDATDASLWITASREATLFLRFHVGSESLGPWAAERRSADGLQATSVADVRYSISGLQPPDWFLPPEALIAEAYQSPHNKRHTWEWLAIDRSNNVVYYIKAEH